MKFGLGVFFLVLSFAHYCDGDEVPLLKCVGFNYDSLRAITVTKKNNEYILNEFFVDSPPKARTIEEKALIKGPITLTPLFGYSRKLIRNEDNIWMLEYGNGIITTIKCEEKKKCLTE